MNIRNLILAALLGVGAATTAASGIGTASASATSPRQISPVRLFSDGSVVAHGWSSLRTMPDRASVDLHTRKLPAGDAVTLWWVIFNHPENCAHGVGGLRCGEGDLNVASVEASVLYADGQIIRAGGIANYRATRTVGDTSGALFGNGLTNPLGADIHLVVHDHGPVIPGLEFEMTHSFGAGCNNVPPGTGTPGPNTCRDVQFSAHEQ